MLRKMVREIAMSRQPDDLKKHWNITGVAIPAGVLTGLGVGFLVDNIPAGLFLGLGGGLLVMMVGMLILQVRKGRRE
jgi:hypothetical protein